MLDLAALAGTETVLDLYCGIGTISLYLARRAAHVIGVEIVPQATEDARRNAELNDIHNAEFFTGRAEKVVPELVRQKNIRADVVVVDPPRKGCDPELLRTILQISPEKLIYVSCDPATLSRDIKYLTENGYRLTYAKPYDQFGMTVHVETCVLLVHNMSTEKFTVEYTPKDSSYMEKLPPNATYREIQEWIAQNYNGMKVSNLYIAQVKQKYGIIERENYNKGEGKAKVPKVTPEKEEAIEAALRHFRLIEN